MSDTDIRVGFALPTHIYYSTIFEKREHLVLLPSLPYRFRWRAGNPESLDAPPSALPSLPSLPSRLGDRPRLPKPARCSCTAASAATHAAGRGARAQHAEILHLWWDRAVYDRDWRT